MSDLLENLQIKRELSPPSTPEEKSPKNIKAKLNRHVKRRLQDYNQSVVENTTIVTANTQATVADIKQETQKTETIRQKRPYHKRTDKTKSSPCLDNTILASSTNEPNVASQRKYKHKIKQIVGIDNQETLNNYTEDYTASGRNSSITAGAVSAGDEDDGCQDNELKASREKEKCPDVLGMVLSMKKRSLMQEPEIQNFLKDIINAIKS